MSFHVVKAYVDSRRCHFESADIKETVISYARCITTLLQTGMSTFCPAFCHASIWPDRVFDR